MKEHSPFIFGYEDASNHLIIRVEIPAGIASKAGLLASIAAKLKFPNYFGDNWEALEACLGDLSWLPSGQVILEHADHPWRMMPQMRRSMSRSSPTLPRRCRVRRSIRCRSFFQSNGATKFRGCFDYRAYSS
ncbi:hypothetical protein D6B98_13710 [Bradyrhizobium sp. LVM 105]|nr:hypothetical protein D6B98_13710 [Bradyrhizobium sp. LVM 105]